MNINLSNQPNLLEQLNEMLNIGSVEQFTDEYADQLVRELKIRQQELKERFLSNYPINFGNEADLNELNAQMRLFNERLENVRTTLSELKGSARSITQCSSNSGKSAGAEQKNVIDQLEPLMLQSLCIDKCIAYTSHLARLDEIKYKEFFCCCCCCNTLLKYLFLFNIILTLI
jgi:hypothetical protein